MLRRSLSHCPRKPTCLAHPAPPFSSPPPQVVRDLNKDPGGWACADGAFDAVLMTASVQYMQRPEEVWAEMARVLKPGGVAIISFSNRMFYEKVSDRSSGSNAHAGGSMRYPAEVGRQTRLASTPHTPYTPRQAIAAWRDSSDYAHCTLVKSYFLANDAFQDPELIRGVELPEGAVAAASGGGLWGALQGTLGWGAFGGGGASDPFFAVVARKKEDA